MKLFNLKLRFFLFGMVLAFFSCLHQIYPQKHIEYSRTTSTSGKAKITDLTNEARKKCSKSIFKQLGNNFLELRYSSEFSNEAEKISVALEQSVKETQSILSPLQVEDVRFYLLQLDKVPSNYKIIDEIKDKSYFLFLEVFKDKTELNFTCGEKDEVCKSIYGIIPHELTHGAIEYVVDSKDTRWFEEGLGNYVGKEVSRKYRPSGIQEKFDEVMPKISLHRADIREDLFLWEHLSSIKKKNDFIKNEWFRYIAAESLIQLIVQNAKAQGVKAPLDILLTKLKEQRTKRGKPANSEDVIFLIQQYLKVNPKTTGVLDKQTQKNLVDEALNMLSQKETAIEEKNYALYVLAGIDDIQLSENWLKYLLKEVYQQKNNSEYQRELAATALSQRFKQEGFDKILENYLKENKELTGKSLKKLKKELQELSIRPPIK